MSALSDVAMELALANRRIASLEHLLSEIPPCPAHGEGCIPHAVEWIKVARDTNAQTDPYVQLSKEQCRTNALLALQIDALLESMNERKDVSDLATRLDKIMGDWMI